MLNIAICDDNEQFCSILEDKVIVACNNFGERTNTDVFYSGEKLRRFIENSCHYDLIYLDIDLITMSGIEIGKKIRDWQKEKHNRDANRRKNESRYPCFNRVAAACCSFKFCSFCVVIY